MSSSVVVLEDNFAAVRNAITGDILMDAAKAGGHVIEGYAKINVDLGHPKYLIKRSGTLQNAINVTESKKSETFAEVNIGPSAVKYAAIHEFGGIIKRVSSKGKVYQIHIPARPYMRPAIDEKPESIRGAVETKIQHSLDRAT